MITIKTPATSANVGPGFDCLGLALELFNTFEVELSHEDFLENVEERFNNSNNLFLIAWHSGCKKIGKDDHVHVIFHTEIPVSRGLGSSSSLIVAGVTAASILHNKALSKDEIFQISAELEGHPDNVAPCIYGGLTASLMENNVFKAISLPVHESWKFTGFIPNFEVSTEKARAILPDSYPRKEAAGNTAHAVYMLKGLETGDTDLLTFGKKDYIHEPYRRKLLPFFDRLQKEYEKNTDGILLISGSGSTCIGISKKYMDTEKEEHILSEEPGMKILHLPVCYGGSFYEK